MAQNRDIDGMTSTPKLNILKQISYIGNIRMQDNMYQKMALQSIFTLSDSNIIESVLMKYKHGLTVCISSQIGCKMGCRFVHYGLGFVRNLIRKMINQILSIQTDCGSRVGNIVIWE